MGAWGTSIYSCDVAEDVRDACNIIYAYFDVEEGNERIFSFFDEIINQDYVDNEYASFWFALSDWQWKHGMLNCNVKEKALELLENYSGLEEWEHTDISKRKKVLDKLKNQLLQPQPVFKKPRVKVFKAKHKPGDIIIFQSVVNNESEKSSQWKIQSFQPPCFYRALDLRNSQYRNIDGFDATGKYMALLCVGVVREQNSEFIEDVFDEHSIYVWYDYLSFIRPSVDDLRKCGFLPYIDWQWRDFNRNIFESIFWGYEFSITDEKFKQSNDIETIIIINDHSEVVRYKYLLSHKNYSSNYFYGGTITSAFAKMFEEKNRLVLIGEQYDNLLEIEKQAPQLLSPREAEDSYNKRIKI